MLMLCVIVVVTALQGTDCLVQTPCNGSDGWFMEGQNCFNLSIAIDGPIHWKSAETRCQADEGGHLATMRDTKDADVITSILNQHTDEDIRDVGVHIGLTLPLNNQTHRWVDGRPLSYTRWQESDPKGGILEACTKMVFSPDEDRWVVTDIPCVAPETKYYLCMRPVFDVEYEPVEPVEGFHCEDKNMFTCNDTGECLHLFFVCDGHPHCDYGEDEINCDTNATEETNDERLFTSFATIECDEKFLPVTFVCDFIFHCQDHLDEDNCVFAPCRRDQFRCSNQKCIDSAKVCDTVHDCLSGDDELRCNFNGGSPSSFQCYNGQWIPNEIYCDGQQDCIGFSSEDEPPDCDYAVSGCSEVELQCENEACYRSEYHCIYGFNHYGYPLGCRDASNLRNCGDFECPTGTLKCPGTYCIQLQYRCDGIWDCPNGEDEQECDTFKCPGFYRCHSTNTKNMCVTFDEVCDGIDNCPLRDDELFCDLECPDSCVCNGLSYICNATTWTEKQASLIPQHVRQIDLTNLETSGDNSTITDILLLNLSDLRLIIHLNLTGNGIDIILSGELGNNANLRTLILAYNNITNLMSNAFQGLELLEHLNLRGNPLYLFNIDAVLPLTQLKFLDVSESSIDIHNSRLDNVSTGGSNNHGPQDGPIAFKQLETLYSDQYYFCCLIADLALNAECWPAPDIFSSCEDLLRYPFLSGLIWIIGVSALIGNAFVIFWRLSSRTSQGVKSLVRSDRSKVQSVLITNLAISDGLMGIYLIIIGSADNFYRGKYAFNSRLWQTSGLCKFAGFLSVLSSEASVFFITIISLDRLVCIVLPMSQNTLKPKSARIVALSTWFLSFLLSIIPLVDYNYFGDVFYGRSPVCLALPLTDDQPAGWQYSVALFLGVNLVAFFIIFLCYSIIFVMVKKSRKGVGNVQNRPEEVQLAIRMSLLIITDFCCWMPIIIIGLLALTGKATISVESYVWTAVFILPLNSALNPFLYTIATREMERYRTKKTKAVTKTAIKKVDVLPLANRIIVLFHFNDRKQYRSYNVSSVLKEGAFISLEDSKTIENDIRKALDYLHTRNIPHGSINDQNVLLEENGGWRAFLIVPTEILNKQFNTTNFSTSCKNEELATLDSSYEDNVDRIEFELNDIYEKDNTQLRDLVTRISARARSKYRPNPTPDSPLHSGSIESSATSVE